MAKKKLTSTKARKILHDKEVHGHPLTEQQRKFFGAIAGGAEPYKAQIGTMLTSLPSNYMETLSETLGFPQKAVTKLVTGKYQTPSEAMGITNPIGAFATDAVLDPVNLLGGAGFTKAAGALDNLYKINPLARKTPQFSNLPRAGEMIRHPFQNKMVPIEEVSGNVERFYPKNVEAGGPGYSAARGSKEWKELSESGRFDLMGKEKGAHAMIDLVTDVEKRKLAIPTSDLAKYRLETNVQGVPNWLMGYPKAPKKQDGGWLDKYEEGGVLKQKKQDNYGTKPNVNNSDVSLPPGFVGMAYNTKGRNYSPAWGGQFQMGGSLPGAVGFTYARTAGAAPANGPYAKKTKASAQNGQEMKYYQEGLDFKPKTISQDGSKTSSKPKKKTLILAEEPFMNKGKFDPKNPFAKEADNIKQYVNKYFPDEDVEIIPAYKESFTEGLKKSDPNTRLVFLGHHGGNLFGIPSDEVISAISKTPYENCYGGTCYGTDLSGIGKANKTEQWRNHKERGLFDVPISEYQGLKRAPESYNLKNLYLRGDHIPWLGFAPVERGGEEGFRDSFFRRTQNPEIIKAWESLREAKSQSEFDKIFKKIDKIRKSGAEYVNTPKAANYSELDVVPFPARTKNYPARPIGLQDGGDLKKAQVGKELRPIPRATGDLRGPKIDPRFAENVAAAKDRDAYSTFEELRSTPGLKLYSDEELAKLSKQDPSKWSKHIKQEYADRQSKKTLVQAHPDYNPEMSFEDQQGLLSDKSLRARVLRGKNLLTGSEYGPAPLAIANQIVTAPANLVSNLAFNPYEKYIRPGAAEGLTNVLSDVMDAIDPVNPGTFMKAALKAAPKTALKLSTALPFYKVLRTTDQASDASKQVFKSYVDRTKELLEQPSSKQAFKNLADKLSISRVRSADPSYVEAINDPTLPIEAVDKMVASLTALDPSEFALSKQQAKYVKELGSLATDMKGAGPVRSEVEGEQVVDWLTTNASNMSPRDLVPLLSNLTQNLGENSKLRLVQRLYDSRAGAASTNPMARYTAAQDLFSLAENYQDISQVLRSMPSSQLSPSTFLGKNIATNIKNIISNVAHVRPMVKIDDPYFFQNAGNINNAQEIFHSLFRNVSHGLPTQQERTAAREYVTKQITQRTKNLFNRPLRQNYQDESDFLDALSRYQSNVGMPFVGAQSMSTDSYELAQRALLMKDRLGFDIFPVHGGTAMDAFPSYTNSFGGITRVGDLRSSYLEDLNKRIGQASLKTIDPASQQAYMSARYSIDPQTIHRALVESAFTNSVNAELNRQLGTNIPAAVYEGFRVNRPLLGFIPKKDGGDIPVDPMGYWNPENVGSPVTIPSNVITMDGVNQPLLGISDTGDVQYMMPGGDYEFDGEYVTEYPMAKKGISVNNADAQPLKKLDQLLNFTNYNKPTKGGWLDKYQ